MDYVVPSEVVSDVLNAAVKKAGLSARDMLIRGALAGVFLGYATSLVFVALSQGLPALTGAIIFPVGFDVGVVGLRTIDGKLRAFVCRFVVQKDLSRRDVVRLYVGLFGQPPWQRLLCAPVLSGNHEFRGQQWRRAWGSIPAGR